MIIDLHSHILPYVDDGASTLDESLRMIALAADCGVRQIVATPHFNSWDSAASLDVLDEAYQAVEEALEEEQIPVKVLKAMEIMASEDLPELLQQEKVWTYPNSNYFLVEFAPDQEPDYFDWLLDRCAAVGFRPVIAHPERYHALWSHPEMARNWCKKGYGVQLNRDSLLGLFGHHAYECADKLLRRGWANCIASDAHASQIRNPHWSSALTRFPGIYGFKALYTCMEETPEKILKNLPLKDKKGAQL